MNESTTDPERTVPDFSLPASTGQTLSLDSFKGKVPLVLVFLTGLESDRDLLGSLNERLSDFGAERAQVLAVVEDTAANTRQFAEEEGIVMPILADASGAMFRDYGAEVAPGEVHRMAVITDTDGRVVRRYDPLPVEGAADGFLTTIRALGSGAVDGSSEEKYTETPVEGY
jgi:thioredoxin-dependent peroxiredoxin